LVISNIFYKIMILLLLFWKLFRKSWFC
jgi:hypothetical protein